jgi:hypothetical protein
MGRIPVDLSAPDRFTRRSNAVVHISTEMHPICTVSAPCGLKAAGLGWNWNTDGYDTRICIDRGAILISKILIPRGYFELSTGKWPCLENRCAKCKENTICCGLLLTCTTDSGTFSSAAVN